MNRNLHFIFIFALVLLLPVLGFASVESSLMAIQGKLVGTILPLAAILGFIFAAFSYVSGNPNAKSHFWLAVIGAGVGFGASSIVAFIRAIVH